MKRLCDRGHSVLLRGLSDLGEYETVQEVRASEYVSLRAELKNEGHNFRVESVGSMTGTVSLQDLTMFASSYPMLRNEPIGYVCELLEDQHYFISEHKQQLSEAAFHLPTVAEQPMDIRVSFDTRPDVERPVDIRMSNDTRPDAIQSLDIRVSFDTQPDAGRPVDIRASFDTQPDAGQPVDIRVSFDTRPDAKQPMDIRVSFDTRPDAKSPAGLK